MRLSTGWNAAQQFESDDFIDQTAQALRTALDPNGSWIPSVLAAADRRLSEVRRHVPDAGGLVIASDQDSARAYAKLLKQISGESATVVLSDEKAASKKISEFSGNDRRWMVAVRMVSEGVDVPRLAVGVFYILAVLSVAQPQGAPLLPLEELEPGMKGEVWTVTNEEHGIRELVAPYLAHREDRDEDEELGRDGADERDEKQHRDHLHPRG